jgi:hypothetical protein
MREQFDEIVGTPPPSTIDTHVLARRVRRTRDARRAGIAATAIVAAGLTGGLLVSNNPPVGTPPVPNNTAIAQADNRIELKSDTRSNGEASAERLAALIEDAVADVAPGAVWINALDVRFIDAGPEGSQWWGSGGLEVGGRFGNIVVMTVGGRAEHEKAGQSGLSCPPDMSGCAEGTSPGGRKMMTFDGGEGSSRLVRAALELPGNRIIAVHHIPEQSGPVLSAAQFLQIFDAVAAQIK